MDTIASYEFIRASDIFATLSDLRSGDTNAAFDSLEDELDTSVISLDAILDEYPTVEHAKNWRILLRRIANYRATYPHHSDVTNMDTFVTEVLAKVKNEGQ